MQMANRSDLLSRSSFRQRGSVLIIGMLLLLMMTLLGLITTTETRTDARITSNNLDRAIAFQSAEAALREAEARIAESSPTDTTPVTGTYTSQIDIPGVAEDAQYVIEALAPSDLMGGYVVIGEVYYTRGQDIYRVMVTATGRSSSTEVVLQTIFIGNES